MGCPRHMDVRNIYFWIDGISQEHQGHVRPVIYHLLKK